MAEITAGAVKELRERTGLGMMECKKALTEANGDMDLAIENMRKAGSMKAAKKAGRTAAEGIVMTKIAMPRIAAVLAERKGRIGGDLAAAEELKSKAKAAETAYNLALEQARLEAAKIIAATKAEIQKDLNAAMADADAQISAKAAESEKRIAEIRAGAVQAVAEVARETAGALVTALGGTADDKAIEAAVAARLKG